MEAGDIRATGAAGSCAAREHHARGHTLIIVADSRRSIAGDKLLLLALSRQLEAEAWLRRRGGPARDLPGGEVLHREVAPRYVEISERAAFVGALGAGLDQPAPGVPAPTSRATTRFAASGTSWSSARTSPGAFVARDLGDEGPDADRRFDFFVTYDRMLVLEAARALMLKIVPDSSPT